MSHPPTQHRSILSASLAVLLSMGAGTVVAAPEVATPPVASKVFLHLESPVDGRIVQPGEEIFWQIRVRVIGPSRGLALISTHLAQDGANPSPIDLPPASGAPEGMEAFDVPAGFTNPGPAPTFSGYGGTPVATSPGGENLLQIGGAQNTFGVPGPCSGDGGIFCRGQSVDVVAGVGMQADGQVVAAGKFAAPSIPGLYAFHLADAQASVLGRRAEPGRATPVMRVQPTLGQEEFSIQVETADGAGTESRMRPLLDGDAFSRGMNTAGKSRDVDAVLRPADGSRLNRTHVRFWWPAVSGAERYDLEIVQDDGSEDPFAFGQVMVHQTENNEPRLVVTQGLVFGRDYAWRVAGATGVQRFSVAALPAGLAPFPVTRPYAGELEPGVTLFNLRSNATPPTIPGAVTIAVDAEGAPVYFHQRDLMGRGNTGYVQIQPTGRLLMMRGRTAAEGGGNAIYEETLDGAITWSSPSGRDYRPHHDAQLMPDGSVLLLLQDDLFLPEDGGEMRRGDRIVVSHRHTLQELWSWRSVDHYPLESGDAPLDRWSHGNAVFYEPLHHSVYYSSRHFSRISRIDYSSGDIVFNMGKEWPAGDTDFGDGFFFFQHAPEIQADGNMVVFDNGNLRTPPESRVVEIEFDDPLDPGDAAVVRQDWLVDESGERLFVPFAGDADRLANGNTLVMAGAINRVQELAPDGRLLWNLSLTQGADTFRAYRAQRLRTVVRDTPGDRDGDWDLDLVDLAGLQAGFNASGLGFPDRLSDFDGDDNLDAADLQALLNWMTGPLE